MCSEARWLRALASPAKVSPPLKEMNFNLLLDKIFLRLLICFSPFQRVMSLCSITRVEPIKRKEKKKRAAQGVGARSCQIH